MQRDMTAQRHFVRLKEWNNQISVKGDLMKYGNSRFIKKTTTKLSAPGKMHGCSPESR